MNEFFTAFFKKHKELLQECKFDELYAALPKYELPSKLTKLLLTANIDPLRHMNSIPDRMFWQLDNLISYKIPKNIQFIGMRAFYGCSNLQNIILQDGVTDIGMSAFGDCVAIEQISIPSTVRSIHCHAFSGCKNLKRITIPHFVTEFEEGIFRCHTLKHIIYDGTPNDWQNIIKHPKYKYAGQVIQVHCSDGTTIKER